MYQISPQFQEFLKRREREWHIKVDVDGVEYGSDIVVDFSTENDVIATDDLEIGLAVISELVLTMKMKDELPFNARIVPYLSLSLDGMTWEDANTPWNEAEWPWVGGSTEWLPLGEFFVDSRERVNDNWVYSCLDKLVYADAEYVSQLNYPTPMQSVWDEICDRLGYEYDDTVVIDPTYTIPAGPAGFTMRQIMEYIASANGASVYVGKDGLIKFKVFDAQDEPVITLDRSDYIRLVQTNPPKTYTRVVLIYDTDDDLYYEAGEGTDAQTMFVVNPWGTQEMCDALYQRLNGFTYVPIEMDARGYPHLEVGDVIGYEQLESMTWEEANVSWDDADFRWDGIEEYQSIILSKQLSFRGGLGMSIQAPSLSDQESEFKVEGTLEQQVNRLTQSSVRYDKPYYGITHSREQGIVVQREDGLSQLILNSDVMDWRVNGVSSLYYDALANRLKFTGTLEAADGVFSGDLSAVGGTFTGTLEGVDGTFSGTISASTVEGGQINGSAISGGEINGTTITGSLIQTRPMGQYPRVELNSIGNLLSAWSTPSDGLFMVPIGLYNAPMLQFTTNTAQSYVMQSGVSFHLINTGLITHIQAEFIDLDASDVNFNSWSSLRNTANQRSLQQELNDIWVAIAALS